MKRPFDPLHPPIVGILGGGQLAQMTIQYGCVPFGMRSVVLEPTKRCPASFVASTHLAWPYDDHDALEELVRLSDVITFDFENIPPKALDILEKLKAPVFPNVDVMRIAQDRRREKTAAEACGLTAAPWQEYHPGQPVHDHLFPGVMKTCMLGYDGKGQVRVASAEECETAWKSLKEAPCIVEKLIEIDYEISVILARRANGDCSWLQSTYNTHKDGTLVQTLWTRDTVPQQIESLAWQQALELAQRLNVVGLLAVEFFVTKQGELLFNEMAPRPHNTGHWSIEGCSHNQFELLIRAITGLPLPTPEPLYDEVVMYNLLGEHVHQVSSYAAAKDSYVHLYGKTEVRPGRKMGHVTCITR